MISRSKVLLITFLVLSYLSTDFKGPKLILMVGLVMIFFSSPSQKLAFMVSLGLVTHDHLEGRKNVLSWFLTFFHDHSELEVQVQNISVLNALFSCTQVHFVCLYS